MWYVEEDLDKPIKFYAHNLFSKYGFDDGGLLLHRVSPVEEFWFDGVYGKCDHTFSHALLITIVEAFVVPLCPPHLKVQHICTSHNPIRFDFGEDEDIDLWESEHDKFDKSLCITLPMSTIWLIKSAMCAERNELPELLNKLRDGTIPIQLENNYEPTNSDN